MDRSFLLQAGEGARALVAMRHNMQTSSRTAEKPTQHSVHMTIWTTHRHLNKMQPSGIYVSQSVTDGEKLILLISSPAIDPVFWSSSLPPQIRALTPSTAEIVTGLRRAIQLSRDPLRKVLSHRYSDYLQRHILMIPMREGALVTQGITKRMLDETIVEVLRRWAAEKEDEALKEDLDAEEGWSEYLRGLPSQDVCMRPYESTRRRGEIFEREKMLTLLSRESRVNLLGGKAACGHATAERYSVMVLL